jgi:hypothetical protein
MNAFRIVAVLALAALALGTSAPPADAQGTPAPSQTQAAAAPVYKPPLLGAPGGRVGGRTRGPARDVFVLTALAPNHTGLTAVDQPSLYWFISRVTKYSVEVTVVDPQRGDLLLEARVPSPSRPGVQRIRLTDFGVRLKPDVAYRWFVAVVPDPARRSKDILAGGTIQRVDPSEEMKKKLAQAGKADLPFLYAEAGLWYDALSALSEQIEAAPQNPALRKQRATMLAQVGLPEIGD